MTTAELIIAVEEAVAACFPQRAADLLAIVRAWIWMSAAVDDASPDEDSRFSPAWSAAACGWCSRGRHLARVLVAGFRARRGDVRFGSLHSGLGGPAVVLCGACTTIGVDLARNRYAPADAVLADLRRALAGSEDGDRAWDEIGRRAGAARLPARAPATHCALCDDHSPPGVLGRSGVFLCGDCLGIARTAVGVLLAAPPVISDGDLDEDI